jgi:branched-chain amino acid transport system substrate-binding protein
MVAGISSPSAKASRAWRKTTISFLAIGINRHFNYPKYFSMVPVGQKGPGAFSNGFFELATAQSL